jgi:hypothetical protein
MGNWKNLPPHGKPNPALSLNAKTFYRKKVAPPNDWGFNSAESYDNFYDVVTISGHVPNMVQCCSSTNSYSYVAKLNGIAKKSGFKCSDNFTIDLPSNSSY